MYCCIDVHQVCEKSNSDSARHIAEYVVKLISDSHNVRLRRLISDSHNVRLRRLVSDSHNVNTKGQVDIKGQVMLKLVCTIIIIGSS